MQEPSASNLPSAYDDDSTLFGALVNHKVFTVKYQVDVETLQLVVNEDASMMDAPLYLTFQGGEIWFVGAGGIAQNTEGEWVFTLETHFTQRAMHGSPLQPHVMGEKVYVGMLSQHVIMAKRVLQAAQKYRFLVGTEADRATTTPEVGERYLCSDSKRIYYCLTAGVWTWINRTHHADLDGLEDNDHPQYAQLADLQGWHGTSGHITNGDDHDHTSPGEGVAIERIRSSTYVAMGAPVTVCDVCFVTDVDGGTLYISFDGVTWEKLSGIPSGAIAMFATVCPSGWTRYTALDDRFPMSGAAAGAVGGNNSHTHSYTDMPTHTHTITGTTVTSEDKGSHTHSINTGTALSGGSDMTKTYGNSTWGTSSGGSHTHGVSIGARTTDTTGGTASTDAPNVALPPYQEVVFCKKN
jgi:hypothetical protein